jgi:hypothetical protein
MSRTLAIRILTLSCLMLFWLGYIVNNGYTAPRHTLIIANEDSNTHVHILELLPTGEIVTTGQVLNVGGYFDHQITVSPDSRFLWCGAYSGSTGGVKQFAITPYGEVIATGRFIAELAGYTITFTPNGQLLLLDSPIYRSYPDGRVESTAHHYIAEYNISPQGNINITYYNSSDLYIDKIDYSGSSVYNIQNVKLENGAGAAAYGVGYTPDGEYAIIANGGGSSSEVEIYPIFTDGSLDTTNVQRFDMTIGNVAGFINVSKDGKYIYVGSPYPNQIGILRLKNTGDGYEDTGWRIPLTYVPWQMEISPDGKYLVITDSRSFQTFAIQDDGNLVVASWFPFETIFGTDPQYFQFAYPPAPTEVDPQWQLYE